MGKNIVICLDGTNNEFGDRNSNVIKMFDLLDLNTTKQTAYYGSGLGTMGELETLSYKKRIKRRFKLIGESMFGYGFFDNTYEAYCYLMDTYETGDRIYIFGFSRGSYTAKALCSMVHMYGLLPKGNYDGAKHLVKRIKNVKTKEDFKKAAEFKSTFCQTVKVQFLGLWDCVSSVGGYNPIHIPYTAKNPSVLTGFHAISIDEMRCFFRANLWSEPAPYQSLEQVWYPGVHSDVGGGYQENERDLADISLRSMAQRAALAGIIFEKEKYEALMTKQLVPTAKQHDELSNFPMNILWWIAEYLPKPYKYQNKDGAWKTWIQMNMKTPRVIPENCFVHQSVLDRKEKVPGYAPKNLPQTAVPWHEDANPLMAGQHKNPEMTN